MRRPIIIPLVLAAALLACGAADKGKAGSANDADKKAADKKDERPACMHCGATCGLVPICICEPGTKKMPKVEFDVTCEPICVAGCGSKPWPFDRCRDRVGCTTCCEEPCRCPGRVRSCKRLKKETTDEEVPTIKRTVAYVCGCCAGRCTAGCCTAGPRPGKIGWWTHLGWLWPQKESR